MGSLEEESDVLAVSSDANARKRSLSKGDETSPPPASSKRIQVESTSDSQPHESSQYLIVHEVECQRRQKGHADHPTTTRFLDPPRLFANNTKASVLHGKRPIPDIEGYLEENKEFEFVVYRRYSCSAYHERIKNDFEEAKMPKVEMEVRTRIRPFLSTLAVDGPLAIPLSENISILNDEMRQAMERVERMKPEHFAKWTEEGALQSPYLGLFHSRKVIEELLKEGIEKPDRRFIDALLKFVLESCSEEYGEADALFAEGKVNKKHYIKLFGPNEVVVTRNEDNMIGMMTTGFPLPSTQFVHCWSWGFDGLFRKEHTHFELRWPRSEDDEIPITDLLVYPLKFDNTKLQEKLRRRGRTFWDCRTRKYISYLKPSNGLEIQMSSPRYMIDIDTYRRMHSDEDLKPREQDDLSQEAMDLQNPPDDPFLLLLPAKIQGYGFHDKKWRILLVEHISPVQWNKRAFDRVVLKSQKKELIKALVTVHLSAMTTTDIIDDKGNGLIMLFHGGPGTGKTLTAESVAELAEKPLYRVTCGDIGTEPESVEKYLDSVLFIGTIWGCIVLLDEADVFLEERTLTDLQRNALVSVFLRVLEYYQGIIILTSNRVGTFDEAFKSRVQLALHYPDLEEEGRWEIWRNFIHGLSKDGQEKDNTHLEEVKDKLDVLARNRLNGRQIRNIVKTAKQLAQYRKEELSYSHFETAIEVVKEFEEYLRKTHGHTDEEYAREQGTRY